MYLLFNSSKHALAFEVVGDQSHLSPPSQALREQIVKRRGIVTDESEIPIIRPPDEIVVGG
jgi:hypothetical protein